MIEPICFQCTPFLPPENIRKPCSFLFSGGKRKVALGTNGLMLDLTTVISHIYPANIYLFKVNNTVF